MTPGVPATESRVKTDSDTQAFAEADHENNNTVWSSPRLTGCIADHIAHGVRDADTG